MAVCEIWDVRGRLDHPIDYAENPEKTANPKYTEADLQAMVDVMEYATNKNKTEQRFFVTGVNCDPNTARDEMMITKAQWNDTSEIVCYHGFQSFKHGEVTPQPQVKVYRVKGSLKNAKKIGGLRGLYLHYCYKLGILPKDRKQNYARLHYLLKDDLMKMEAITQETRLLCRNHIDTAEQLCSYKGSLETEMSALLQKRKELYSKSRRTSGEEKEAVKAELSDISGRLKIIRKEVRLCEGIAARSDTLKEKLQTIRADEHEQQRKELMKNEHRRRSGRTNRPNELGGL